MIRAGELRDRVTLQRWTPADDPRWGQGGSWTEYATVWASVTPTQAVERLRDQGVQSEVSHQIRLRYRPDVAAKDRVLYRGKPLDVVGVIDPDGRKRELMIEAKEHASNG